MACYIINTGFFMDKKIPKEMTLEIIEKIVEDSAEWKPLNEIPGMQIMEIPGFVPDFSDANYKQQFINRMNDRMKFVKSRETEKGGIDKLPQDAIDALEKVISNIK